MPMVPENPGPPNQPNIFCAPCAKKTTPSTSLRSDVVALSSVAYSRRNIVSPPWIKRFVFGLQRTTYLDIKIDVLPPCKDSTNQRRDELVRITRHGVIKRSAVLS